MKATHQKIQSLETKHKNIDKQLEELYKHSSADCLEAVALKKQKLAIKDQINTLKKEHYG
jgi:hypothetical protein